MSTARPTTRRPWSALRARNSFWRPAPGFAAAILAYTGFATGPAVAALEARGSIHWSRSAAPSRTGPMISAPRHCPTPHDGYSPKLNPMENVWDLLYANRLCNLVWDTCEKIVDDCVTSWNLTTNDPNRIRSIGAGSWACVSDQAGC